MRPATVLCLWSACLCLLLAAPLPAHGQAFRYQEEPGGTSGFRYANAAPAPGATSPTVVHDAGRSYNSHTPWNGLAPSRERLATRSVKERRYDAARARASDGVLLTSSGEPIPAGRPLDPFGDDPPPSFAGEVYYDDYEDGFDPRVGAGPFLEEPCPTCGYDGHCGECDDCVLSAMGRCLRNSWHCGAFCENASLYFGRHGFKGPVDQGVNGNFGFHGGLNYAIPLIDSLGIGYQIGGNIVASDFAGRTGVLGHRRTQYFITTGVFHRAVCNQGWQGGAAFDYLHDDFYITMDLMQVRGELSYLFHCNHEVGFWGAWHTNTTTQNAVVFPNTFSQAYTYQANNQYNVFYRYNFCNGTEMRTWGGISGHGDGIFGSDATVRISDRLGLMASYNYLIPRNDPSIPNNVKETWNVAVSLVWYPGYKRCDSWVNPYRPLFPVADNGWFMVRQVD